MTAKPGPGLMVDTRLAGGVSAAWHAHVAGVLKACKNETTETEALRLAKALARLQDSAESALAQAVSAQHDPQALAATLKALSHG